MKILIDGQTFETPELNRGIGVYMRNTLNHMLKVSLSHEWYVFLSDEKTLDNLDPWTRNRLHVIASPDLAPGSDYSRESRFTEILQGIVDQYHIDAVWNPNPLMANVLFVNRPLTCRMFVTVHDIIPKVFPPADWPDAVAREYQRRLVMIRDEESISMCMDSESTRNDWISYLDDRRSSIRVIPLSADACRFYVQRKKTRLASPYILYTGGFDYRKNLDGAIDAFSRARRLHSDDPAFMEYRLVIVGSTNEQTLKRYKQVVDEKGLADWVEFTGFVSEKRLVELYRDADLFFFPSKYEGFGLPLLEAMLSGDYIVSADNSSLPEVCGPFATYFSVDDPDQMAEALYLGYRNHLQETEEDIRNRQEHALGFSWDQTAILTLRFMEESLISSPPVRKKPSLAVFTPWLDQKTGIANYEYLLMPYLAEYFDITVFTTAPAAERKSLDCITITDLHAYQASDVCFDYRLFQIGNNDLFHKDIMDLLMREGGIAEIHDYVLMPFFFAGYYESGERKTFRKLLQTAYGKKKGTQLYRTAVQNNGPPNILEYPMSEAVVAFSDKVIIHNAWTSFKLASDKTGILPHPSFPIPEQFLNDPPDTALTENVGKWKKQGYLILGCMGWINPNKQPQVVVKALRKLIEEGFPVKLVFWGENNDDTLPDVILENKVENDVFISGYLNKQEYYRAIRLTDIVINLRHPSMGESSGPLCEAFQMEKAVIVSDLNQYREYPNEVCWKVPVDEFESGTLAGYIRHLFLHPDIRQTLERNARSYAAAVLSPKEIARQYYDFITRSR